MEYKIKENNIKYEVGKYFIDGAGYLYQIIYDRDQGYAILDVKHGTIESDFQETIEFLLQYTTIKDMKPVKQIVAAEFEVVVE
jgi:hypothetical protein